MTIFYFSATGNSRYVAEKLSREFGMEMKSISDAMKNHEFTVETGKDEKIFFVSPVYYWGLPDIVKSFLEQISFIGESKPEVCGILTCGSSAGGADEMFRKALKQRPCTVKAVYKVVMPDNCVVYFNVPNPEAQVMMLRKSEKEIEDIIEDIRFNFRMSYKSSIGQRVFTKTMYNLYKRGRSTKKFRVQESCIGCGLCQRICPVQAISIEEDHPVWIKTQCTWCLGCINRCPTEAIQYGNATEKRGRYVHPDLR